MKHVIFYVKIKYLCCLLNIYICIITIESTSIWQNVAHYKHGAVCHASSERGENYWCMNALDGSLMPNGFQSNNEGVGLTLNITFDQAYTLAAGRMMNQFCDGSSNKDVRLSFKDGTIIDVSTS